MSSSSVNVVVQPVAVDDVIAQDTARYNSNNHGEPPEDYNEVLAAGRAENWIDSFKEGYITLKIKSRHLPWLKKAAELGQHTKSFSKLYEDELEDLLNDHKEFNSYFADGTPYFVRTGTVSLKYGKHGAGPYRDLKSIIESAVTSMHGHAPIHRYTKDVTFYLIPWVNIDMDKEFRVFVCNNRITAISQQVTTMSNQVLAALPDEQSRIEMATKWVHTIANYWQEVISKRITHISSYTIDIALVEDDQPYFIEINCFGKEYAAGSSLYHWLIDEDILYGLAGDNEIYFRYAY